MPELFECVPNVSEGRRPDVIKTIGQAAADGPGVALVDTSSDASHNRSVYTLVGTGQAVVDAALRLATAAVERIDMREHKGEHPRMGAVDVIPFIPLGEATMEAAVDLARSCARQIWERLALPCYFYGFAATRPERRKLADVRKVQFEGLRAAIKEPDRRPDVGDPEVHPSAGCVAIGARNFLIAYNVNLATSDLKVAERIASGLRESSGGLTGIQAKGFRISDDIVQVSMNVTDIRATPLYRVTELVRREAAAAGALVCGCELVGVAPLEAVAQSAAYYLHLDGLDPAQITW